jgi:mono/diheme cytochrome c family protein
MLGSNAAAQYRGWFIPEGGAEERNPLKRGATVVSRGRAVYASHCASCHGADGKGSDLSSDHAADLTDDLRTALNPEGVLFYKVWNGHAIQLKTQVDDMPAFRDRLSRDDVWAVVAFLEVLRQPVR